MKIAGELSLVHLLQRSGLKVQQPPRPVHHLLGRWSSKHPSCSLKKAPYQSRTLCLWQFHQSLVPMRCQQWARKNTGLELAGHALSWAKVVLEAWNALFVTCAILARKNAGGKRRKHFSAASGVGRKMDQLEMTTMGNTRRAAASDVNEHHHECILPHRKSVASKLSGIFIISAMFSIPRCSSSIGLISCSKLHAGRIAPLSLFLFSHDEIQRPQFLSCE